MIYEQHRTTADYNGNSLWNWPDEKIIVCRADLTKSALITAKTAFFFFLFLIHFSNLSAVTDKFSGVLVERKEEAIASFNRE